MGTHELFGLAVRILGVVLICFGLQDLLDSSMLRLGYFTLPDSTPAYYLIRGLITLVAGAYLLRGAPLLAEIAYRVDDEDDEATKISRSTKTQD
ncbi:MAG TPA: hypothetical protein VFD48_17540 [Pyrinomonadaceae bacterium]|nr:hypothetical protein [Pyrinomonadaceae bacterium]